MKYIKTLFLLENVLKTIKIYLKLKIKDDLQNQKIKTLINPYKIKGNT